VRRVELEELARHPLANLDDFRSRVEVMPGQLRHRGEAHARKHRVTRAVVQRDLAWAKPAQEVPKLPVRGRGDREPDSPPVGIDGNHPAGDAIADFHLCPGQPWPAPVQWPNHPDRGPGNTSRATSSSPGRVIAATVPEHRSPTWTEARPLR